MNELILHHYTASPYSEKVRTILGFKGLAYRSVQQPQVMPKPDQLALTGGYRKAPLLQIGAHIYCDTNLIAEVLERLMPEPTIYPAPVAGVARMAAAFADQTLFRAAAMLIFQPQDGRPKMPGDLSRKEMIGLLKDRTKMMEGARVAHVPPDLAPVWFEQYTAGLNVQLQHAGPFLCGPAPSIADFSTHQFYWFLEENLAEKQLLADYPAVLEWKQKIDAFRKAPIDELEPAAAVELAAKSTPPEPEQAIVQHPKLKAGDTVEVMAADYGFDAVKGTLVKMVGNEIAVQRTDERAGEMIIHFPIIGYEVKAAE